MRGQVRTHATVALPYLAPGTGRWWTRVRWDVVTVAVLHDGQRVRWHVDGQLRHAIRADRALLRSVARHGASGTIGQLATATRGREGIRVREYGGPAGGPLLPARDGGDQ